MYRRPLCPLRPISPLSCSQASESSGFVIGGGSAKIENRKDQSRLAGPGDIGRIGSAVTTVVKQLRPKSRFLIAESQVCV